MLPDLKRYMAERQALGHRCCRPTTHGRTGDRSEFNFIDNAWTRPQARSRSRHVPQHRSRLWPGQYVNVSVTLSTEPNAIVVPSLAVQTRQQGTYVFVVKPDSDGRPASGEGRTNCPAISRWIKTAQAR